ncbi:hypothetical protein BABINDRAFT_32731 [Babjeviella inositovora NRRL Y-12698]|uniref:IMP-specific 5'-nucleotidase 1 n=1 Tax=Babjeviella inositovora NRRL Y-12698 TaxID=984486 RepID=A0A1E3QWS3_9ASCO|nr:uncharacterized protein BABINDRAFT_32731 [Babjeviella inositovora NRRL Y-12698]ODQ81447.1 hypothetical protein BABINDRAFT_32731 [Babjeviella inositovora NRRL Y-12698]
MTSRYRVEYALKVHRRDEFIEWIKGLLAVPFVLHSGNGITASTSSTGQNTKVTADARRRYAEVFYDLERLIEDKITQDNCNTPGNSRLKQLVPTVGEFYTKLPLERAFYVEDARRSISVRRLVAPSFNDVRLILNTAQVLALSASGLNPLKLVTFDGDITLYEDGLSLTPDAPIVLRLKILLKRDLYVALVTAAGYAEISGEKYYQRLKGLLDLLVDDQELTDRQKRNLLIMGGESNFLFRYDTETSRLKYIADEEWQLENVKNWDVVNITKTLDFAEKVLGRVKEQLSLPAVIIRKERAVGIVAQPGNKLCREQLEEIVLTCQKKLDIFAPAQGIKFCAFNGGSDVWVDIGDKALGVESLQKYIGFTDLGLNHGIGKGQTLHVGDQFAAIGANDYKARLSACTAWIANPTETVDILDDLIQYMDEETAMGFV